MLRNLDKAVLVPLIRFVHCYPFWGNRPNRAKRAVHFFAGLSMVVTGLIALGFCAVLVGVAVRVGTIHYATPEWLIVPVMGMMGWFIASYIVFIGVDHELFLEQEFLKPR